MRQWFAEFFDIGTCEIRAPSANDQHSFGFALCTFDPVHKSNAHRMTKRIHRRVVRPQNSNVAFQFILDWLAHRIAPLRVSCGPQLAASHWLRHHVLGASNAA